MAKKGPKSSFINKGLSAKIAALYGSGKTDKQVADTIGVSLRTIHYWKSTEPDFLHSLKEGKNAADELVESSLFRRATGYSHDEEKIFVYEGRVIRVKTEKHYPPDVSAQIFWLKNRKPTEWRDTRIIEHPKAHEQIDERLSFEEFCIKANYPKPFEKQVEMLNFGMSETVPRLLLGARGYGKTDYVVILGIAYELYLDPMNSTTLIITKSRERNAAMLKEIKQAAEANGVIFEKANANCLRVQGLHGKDHSVSAVTIKTVTLRGRHPKRVIMDDPVTEDDVSEATRKKVEAVYNEVTKLCQNVLIIGQPAHKFDLYAKLRPLLKKLEVPWSSIPELDHDIESARLAGVSEASIQASYFLKILSEGTTPFDNVKYIDKTPKDGGSIAFVDPSHEGGDYTAISIIKGYMEGVIVTGFCFKKAWNHALDDMAPLLRKYNVQKLIFETNSLGDMPIDILRKTYPAVGIVGRRTVSNKHSRIMAAGAYAHMIHLSRESDKAYIDQVVQYEYGAKVDDSPDSLASGLEVLGLIRGR
jgi:hypothetical protein